MKVLDPGHTYELQTIDTPEGYFDGKSWQQVFEGVNQMLTFVKRTGDKYPGNEDAYPGTIIQDVYRVCVDRLRHVDIQEHDYRNDLVIAYTVSAFYWLEHRAAEKHGLLDKLPSNPFEVFKMLSCDTCGHVLCEHRRQANDE